MKILAVSFLLVFFLFVVLCPAQSPEVVFFSSGSLSRPGSNHIQPVSGYPFVFRFLSSNTDVSGIVNASTALNVTEINSNCCFYGKRFVVADFAEGNNNFRQGTDPVVVDGTTWPQFGYGGTIRFSGSALVPMYLKKRAQASFKVQITVSGHLQGFPILPFAKPELDPMFDVPFNNLKGTATYTIRRHDIPVAGMENHFDIVSVTYELTSNFGKKL